MAIHYVYKESNEMGLGQEEPDYLSRKLVRFSFPQRGRHGKASQDLPAWHLVAHQLLEVHWLWMLVCLEQQDGPWAAYQGPQEEECTTTKKALHSESRGIGLFKLGFLYTISCLGSVSQLHSGVVAVGEPFASAISSSSRLQNLNSLSMAP